MPWCGRRARQPHHHEQSEIRDVLRTTGQWMRSMLRSE